MQATTQTNNPADLMRELIQVNKAIAAANPPGWVRPLAEYKRDWCKAIGATVYAEDENGPTIVNYHGVLFGRRTGSGNKGLSIWYSRAIGKDSYQRLITFKDSSLPQPEQMNRDVVAALAKL